MWKYVAAFGVEKKNIKYTLLRNKMELMEESAKNVDKLYHNDNI